MAQRLIGTRQKKNDQKMEREVDIYKLLMHIQLYDLDV